MPTVCHRRRSLATHYGNSKCLWYKLSLTETKEHFDDSDWPNPHLGRFYWPYMKNPDRWRELCEQASREQDPEKLLELTREIIRLLDEKETRLKDAIRPTDPPKI